MVFRRASESLYVYLGFMCCLKSKNIIGDSIILVYIVRVKIFEFDSPRTTTIASRRTQTLDKEVAQGNVKQRIEDQPRVALLPLSVPWRHTPKTRLTASKLFGGSIRGFHSNAQPLPRFGFVVLKLILHV